MKFLSVFVAIVMIMVLAPLCAIAGTLLSDQNLANPNGVYYGSGNFNGGWTTNNDASGIELGLRAKMRDGFTATATIINSATNVYDVPVGTNITGTRALWNYDWSINLAGTFGITLPDITAFLTITDVGTGISATINPLTYWGDNSGWGYPNVLVDGKPVVVGLNRLQTAPGITLWGAQNSENPKFADFPLSSGFNALTVGKEYRFDLAVFEGGTQLASDTMFVDTTAPEPASFLLIGGGLLAIGVYRRRRKSV